MTTNENNEIWFEKFENVKSWINTNKRFPNNNNKVSKIGQWLSDKKVF